MRAKRSKRYRKIMQQYGLNFGFREPYQVLVTTSFLRATHRFHMSLTTSLAHTLHGQVKPFITKCSLATLSSSPRPVFLPPPTDLPLRHCTHNGVNDGDPLPEAECLLDHLSGGALSAHTKNPDVSVMRQARNKEHFVLASADEGVEETKLGKRKREEVGEAVELRSLARKIPGVPIVYVGRSVMVLEELSGVSLGVRGREEKEKVGRVKKKVQEEDKESDGEEGKGDEEAEEPKKKRKRGPKGANPLSVKKKRVKVKNVDDVPENGRGSEETDNRATEPKRRRRKHKKSTISNEAQADQDVT